MPKEINWDDQDAAKRDDSFRGKKDKWDRFVIMDPNATMSLTHYAPRIRYWECTQPSEGRCTDCEKGEEARERYGAIICLYNTNELGAPSSTPLSFKMTWWAFGPDKFQVLRMAKLNFGDLRKHDIIVQCTEEQYQKMTIQAMMDAWWLKDKAFTEQVAKAYKEYTQTHNLMKKLARRIPFQDQAQVLAGRDRNNDRGGQRDNRQQPAGGYQPNPGFQPSFGGSPAAPPSVPSNSPPSPSAAPNPIPPSAPSAGDTVDLDSMLNDLGNR